MQKNAKLSVFLALGALVLGLAIVAPYFGLDTDPDWGKGRISLLILGLLIAFIPWILNRHATHLETVIQSDLFALPVLLMVIGVYFWFITVSHDSTSNYYSLLATSFRNGELSLPLKPNPALLQLPNPYDPAAREGIKVPLDLSLYNGKFYLYWGPGPSLLLALIQMVLPGRMAEVDLLFLFMSGIFLMQYLLILHIWEKFFPEIPKRVLILSIVLAGFANPALWLFGQPKIYEAAIAGAQFFFIAGFLSAVLALSHQPPSKLGLALSGILWTLAVETRLVAILPVIFMTLMVIYLLFKIYSKSFPRFVAELLPLGLPLFIGAVGLAWYNWARFGSFFETGFTYQLAGPYLQQHLSELFLPGYIFQNLYNYLLNPFTVKQSFPFLFPVRGLIEEVLPWQVLPDFYTAQAITGLLCAVPFTIFALVPMTMRVKRFLSGNTAQGASKDAKTTLLEWIIVSLIGSFALPFLSLLAFFWAAMRYVEDFMPELILLSIIGFWQTYRWLSQSPQKSKIYTVLGVVLAGVSIINAILLALSIYYTNGLL